jgi:threonyl-tRNA synthetase
MLVMGDREVTEGTIALRSRTGGDLGSRSVEAFLEAARAEIARKGVAGAGDVASLGPPGPVVP